MRNFNLKGTFVKLRVSFDVTDGGDELRVEQVEKGQKPVPVFYALFREIEEQYEDAYEDFEADEGEEGTNH